MSYGPPPPWRIVVNDDDPQPMTFLVTTSEVLGTVSSPPTTATQPASWPPDSRPGYANHQYTMGLRVPIEILPSRSATRDRGCQFCISVSQCQILTGCSMTSLPCGSPSQRIGS
jgi:hypothetical protein